MKIIFLGTPQFAVLPLQSLNKSNHEILAVVSQPDRETDKKGNLLYTPVKKCALELNLKVFQYEKVSREGIEELKSLKPDAFVTAAYGQMLSQEFLSLAKYGVYNIHASLLPKHRGASPIQSAILNGDNVSGVTIMKTVLKMDAGDIYKTGAVQITDATDFLQLHNLLSEIGAKLIVETLDEIERGNCNPEKQTEEEATYCKKITKADGHIDFCIDARSIVRKINAFSLWPCAYAFYNNDNLKIYKAEAVEYESEEQCGTILFCDDKNGLIIKCKDGALRILAIQAPGKKQMNAADFLRGYKMTAGEILK